MSTLYPAFLNLHGLPVIVVGGGPVAASKLGALLEAGARITIVSPAICDDIRTRVAQDEVQWLEAPFGAHHLVGARWVVAAATPEVNREVSVAATARGLFVNAVDDVANASAYLGGVIRRGDVTIAVSTRGIAPALAGLLREALEAVLPADLDRWIETAKTARVDWKRAHVPMAERRPLLLRALHRLYAEPA
ncbi:MAG: bifunctional precorrin-2 dehydrogenase/sirohydrochlorin ferrochelatase [Proteobacteria bacterium]|nr:bifunctional precorrin-2 dehydrogenase/sirohydrochlorin ferrochelatase [Pseudomonadota bacterium]